LNVQPASLPALPPDGPRLRLSAGRPHSVVADTLQPVTLIGSRRDCHLPILHGEVSKLHAAVCNTGAGLLVCDLRTRTGTFINDRPIQAGRLSAGDTLRLGNVAVQVGPCAGHDGPTPESAAPAEPDQPVPLKTPLRLRLASGVVELLSQPAVIGRRNNCDVFVDTPDVSLAHALVFELAGRPVIYDLGSRSGTLVNGTRISLSWLANGDQVNIGGETLIVEQRAPETASIAADTSSAAPPEVTIAASATNPATGAPAPADAVLGDVLGLQSALSSLQARMVAFRGNLEQRAQALDRRESDIEALADALSDDRAALERRMEAFESARAGVEQARTTLDKRRRTLLESVRACREIRSRAAAEREQAQAACAAASAAQTALEATRTELEQERSLVEAQRAECAVQAEALRTERAALNAARAQHGESVRASAEQAAALAERDQALAEREQALAERDQALAERERQLDAREAASDEMTTRIQQVRAALDEAAQMFMTATDGAAVCTPDVAHAAARDAAGTPLVAKPVTPAVALHQSRLVGSAADAAAGAIGAAPIAANATTAGAIAVLPSAVVAQPLPAPMVDQPLFGSATTAMPADLPPEVRERFCVLRRVSDKSDADLLAQVMAEAAAARLDREQAHVQVKKRRWWA
jgi:pSer/pThr/pTyr-binding forkhead associated (FHA) protein